MSLSALVAAALVSLAHLGQASADELAAPIAEVASTREEAFLLAVTLDAEGGTRPKVLDCRILGDNGRAFGGYQLHVHHLHGARLGEFCRDPKLQASLALVALSHGDTIRTRIASFMGRRENDREVSRRVTRYDRLINNSGDDSK